MRHVPSPVLRRLADEPMAVPDRDRRHLAGCDRCQAESSGVAADAAVASRLLAAPPDLAGAADVDLEWIMLQERLRQPGAPARPVARVHRRMPRRLVKVSLGTGTAVAAGVVALGVGAAAALNSIYTPTHVAPVTVSPADLAAVENIAGLSGAQLSGNLPPSGSRQLAFGELSWTSAGRPQQVSSIARASALTHLAFSAPATLPAGVGPASSIEIAPQVTATVRFNASAGAAIGGSTLQVTAGPAIVVQYGSRTGQDGLTTLAVGVMARPVASSTGATASQLEAFLLSRPGLPRGLVQELRILGHPGTTLPVPVPPGMSAQQLKIGGAPAVLLTAGSGVASGVIWESRDGVVHGVGGLLDSGDVLGVARQIG
jgi:hypothetical protein